MRRLLAPLLLAALALAGCQTNPATGRQQFTAFMSPADEIRVGREEHPQVLRQFGGEYGDPKVRAYVQELGLRLAARSEMPELEWRFTVLNSDVVNAFALPGGYVYVTRALLALASTEAELAGVLGHEIGHVTGRHTAERHSRAAAAQIGATGLGLLVGVLTGSGALASGAAQAAGSGAQVWIAGYSRDQEFQADELGVRYLARNGYDPGAMARFLEKLDEDTRLAAEIMGRPGAAEEFSILQTHPRTPERVRAAIAEAGEAGQVGRGRVGREDYLREIDGLPWGGDAESGFVRNRLFVHPALRVKFEVPLGFRLINLDDRVIARGPGNSGLSFGALRGAPPRGGAEGLAELLRQNRFQGVSTFAVDKLPAAVGGRRATARDGTVFEQRLVLIAGEGRVWRFVFLAPADAYARFDEGFRRTTYSFDLLTPAEAAALRSYRIRLARAGAGDTPETMARRMLVDDFALRRFLLINGLHPGERLEPGRDYKIVAE